MAKRLEGRPFHLVASHCQRNPQDQVVSYIKSKGLEATTPNVTVTSFGRHPKVHGNGYVPYYMVFDHHGKLVHHHMCGSYHGGDGLEMIEWVDKLLKQTPEIYVGEAPFQQVPKLAAQVSRKKKLAAAVKTIEAELDARPQEARREELQRLYDAVTAWRDQGLDRAVKLAATNPPGVIPLLKQLTADLKGTKLGESPAKNLAQLQKDPALRQALKIWKSFQKTVQQIDKMKDPTPAALDKKAKRLEKLIAGHEQLPVVATIKSYIESLR